MSIKRYNRFNTSIEITNRHVILHASKISGSVSERSSLLIIPGVSRDLTMPQVEIPAYAGMTREGWNDKMGYGMTREG
jgi:hypothetical protein